MTKSRITFRELKELLLDLGFRDASKESGFPRFEQPDTGTILLFRAHRSNQLVGNHEIVFVRRQLVDNGLIDPVEFDRFVLKVPA
jgi:hypothetical protein